jgi:predicted HTH transcriptional regulator
MLINKNPKTTATEIAKILAIPPRAVEKVIARLKAEGKLQRIDPAKGCYWEIIQK